MFGYNSVINTIPGLSNDAAVGDGTGIVVQGDIHSRTVHATAPNSSTTVVGADNTAFFAAGLDGNVASVLRAQYASTTQWPLIWFLDHNGDNLFILDFDSTMIVNKGVGFWGIAPPAARPVLATGASRTVDNVISLLQSYGLCKQS